MIMNGDLLKRLMKEKKEDVVHSSAYAEAQNQGGIGAVSAQSFNQRRNIDQNRSVIRKYGDSKVVAEGGRTSWQARRDAAQFGGDSNENNTSSNSGLRGRLNSKDSETGAKGGDTPTKSGPTQMPTRKNPGISR